MSGNTEFVGLDNQEECWLGFFGLLGKSNGKDKARTRGSLLSCIENITRERWSNHDVWKTFLDDGRRMLGASRRARLPSQMKQPKQVALFGLPMKERAGVQEQLHRRGTTQYYRKGFGYGQVFWLCLITQGSGLKSGGII